MTYRSIDENFFKTWDSNMAYVLGYIVADGCVLVDSARKRNPYTLNITSRDKDHLVKISKALGSDHKISRKQANGKVAHQIQIRNFTLVKDLLNLGVPPRKGDNLEDVRVKKEFFSDYFRGYFDGDGSVYIYQVNGTPQIKASLTSKRLRFISRINKRVCQAIDIPLKNIHKKSSMGKVWYDFNFYIDDCRKLFKFMYDSNPKLFLNRKKAVFKKWQMIKRRGYIKNNYPSKIGWVFNQPT